MSHYRRLWGAGLLGACFAAVALGQGPTTEREVPSQSSPGDTGKVWTLDFRFKDPRIIKVHMPGKGTRIYYYLWYQVINRTGKPQPFNPMFELVTVDYPGVHTDVINHTVQDEVSKIEDPTGYQEIRNSVEMGLQKIPVSKPPDEAFPRAVTGVAIWEVTQADPAKRDPKVKDISDSANFSIFVPGLSNAVVMIDPLAPGLEPMTRRKTLQLNFRRKTQRFTLDSRDIEFVPNAEWIYRASSPPKRAADKKEPEKKAP
jgi:hypothetical protein